MTNHIISQILRHPVYFLAITLSATTCYLLIMVNYIFILTVTRLRIPQNDTSVKVKNFYSGTSRTFEIHSKIPGRARASNNTKLILLWNPLFTGMEFLQEGHKSFNHSSCSESRCEIISDRNRLAESNAILFHLRTFSLLDIPRRRSSNQKWIFFSLEAPPYSNFPGLSFMHDMFNWTMTYRNDSDVVMTYGRSARNIKSSFTEKDVYSLWKKKTKMAVWMASHCHTHSKREEYVKQMAKHMDVVTYGECGVAVCPFNRTDECLKKFSQQYFFYLAFENSICDDYVTEKFFRTLKYNMIPVVFGGGKYSKIAPPGSYIDALDFYSPKDLSDHLYSVASRFAVFAEYFRWKIEGYDVYDVPDPCALCENYIHNPLMFILCTMTYKNGGSDTRIVTSGLEADVKEKIIFTSILICTDS